MVATEIGLLIMTLAGIALIVSPIGSTTAAV